MADELRFPRPFVLRRAEDPSGVSGVGEVAEGVVFGDGTVALRWRSSTASTVLYGTLDDALAVHGHDGRTTAVFADEEHVDREPRTWREFHAWWKAWRRRQRAREAEPRDIRRKLAELGLPW